jgi:hypothetical protein
MSWLLGFGNALQGAGQDLRSYADMKRAEEEKKKEEEHRREMLRRQDEANGIFTEETRPIEPVQVTGPARPPEISGQLPMPTLGPPPPSQAPPSDDQMAPKVIAPPSSMKTLGKIDPTRPVSTQLRPYKSETQLSGGRYHVPEKSMAHQQWQLQNTTENQQATDRLSLEMEAREGLERNLIDHRISSERGWGNQGSYNAGVAGGIPNLGEYDENTNYDWIPGELDRRNRTQIAGMSANSRGGREDEPLTYDKFWTQRNTLLARPMTELGQISQKEVDEVNLRIATEFVYSPHAQNEAERAKAVAALEQLMRSNPQGTESHDRAKEVLIQIGVLQREPAEAKAEGPSMLDRLRGWWAGPAGQGDIGARSSGHGDLRQQAPTSLPLSPPPRPDSSGRPAPVKPAPTALQLRRPPVDSTGGDEQGMSDADLWEKKRREGLSVEQATAYVNERRAGRGR